MTYQVAEMALVWRSPVTGRRFFSRAAAISATTRQIIRKRINDEDSDLPSYLEHEHPEQFEKMFRRLRIKVAKATPTASPSTRPAACGSAAPTRGATGRRLDTEPLCPNPLESVGLRPC